MFFFLVASVCKDENLNNSPDRRYIDMFETSVGIDKFNLLFLQSLFAFFSFYNYWNNTRMRLKYDFSRATKVGRWSCFLHYNIRTIVHKQKNSWNFGLCDLENLRSATLSRETGLVKHELGLVMLHKQLCMVVFFRAYCYNFSFAL